MVDIEIYAIRRYDTRIEYVKSGYYRIYMDVADIPDSEIAAHLFRVRDFCKGKLTDPRLDPFFFSSLYIGFDTVLTLEDGRKCYFIDVSRVPKENRYNKLAEAKIYYRKLLGLDS